MAMHFTSFSVLCDFSGNKQNVPLQIGYPEIEHHPLHFQADFLGKSKGGSIPPKIMESIQKIYRLSIENNVDFVELAEYAIKSMSSGESVNPTNKKDNNSNGHENADS